MSWWLVIVIPVTGACIGYIANGLLLKLLFHPQKPIKILGFTIQGIFPKKQPQLARQIGALVSNELLSFSDIEEKITSIDNVKKIMPVAEAHIDDFLRNRLKDAFPMIGMLIGDKTINTLKTLFMNELESIFPVIMKGYMQNLQKDLNLGQVIADKVAALSSTKLETFFYQAMTREMRLFKVTGGLIGLVIGLIQVLLTIIFVA